MDSPLRRGEEGGKRSRVRPLRSHLCVPSCERLDPGPQKQWRKKWQGGEEEVTPLDGTRLRLAQSSTARHRQVIEKNSFPAIFLLTTQGPPRRRSAVRADNGSFIVSRCETTGQDLSSTKVATAEECVFYEHSKRSKSLL